MKKLIYTTLSITVLTSLSCTKTQFDEYETNNGDANFTTFISLGDSYTQGFQDGGLHNEHDQQANSYPSIIAKQMGANFVQPLVSGTGSGYMHLEFRNGEIEVIKAFDPDVPNNDPNAIDYDPSFNTWANKSIKYNNLAVGGLNVRNVFAINTAEESVNHIYLGNGAPAPLAWNGVSGEPISPYGRFLDWGTLSNPVEYIEQIRNSSATFFTNWLGVNDAMSWAKEGGDDISGSSLQTLPSNFRIKYDSVLTILQDLGAQGVCATIPDVTEMPFFTTITLDILLKDVWIKEGADTTMIRKATNDDLILLTAKGYLEDNFGNSASNPLPHQVVLDKDEIVLVKNHTSSLNAEIMASASKHGYSVVDMHGFMGRLVSGMNFDGVDYSTKFIEGGAYSIDGLHPNTRGYAFIANEFIKVINSSYGSELRPVSPSNYKGIVFP
ncbi:MAG: SGNH/GDSL hydrolase family protein [Vicingaceae bacterium]|nr:SGNH/GDSL hydrolase family protein [Vicingaceae bacterium]